jgi:glycosyltransferase involved in cell wall biosynthesis
MVALSVVIPTLNAWETLEAQLQALLRQPGEFEVIVADNGSTDDTRRHVEDLAARDPRVRYIDASALRGGAHAKNQGVIAARHEYVAFCDADDLVANNWVRGVAAALERVPLVSIPREYGLLNQGQREEPKARVRTKFGAPCLSGGAFAIRRDWYLDCGGFDAFFSGSVDDEFSIRLFKRQRRQPTVADTCVHVRLQDGLYLMARRKYLLARSMPVLAARYPDMAPAQGIGHGVKRWVALGTMVPGTLTSAQNRAHWIQAVAVAAGLAVGSIEARKAFL